MTLLFPFRRSFDRQWASVILRIGARGNEEDFLDPGRHRSKPMTSSLTRRTSLSPTNPSVIIGNKSSVHVGQGVFVGKGSGVVPLDDPNAPNKTRCAILDRVSYCY